MSDAPGGPGWWQASDQKWYPPEAAPGGQSAPQAQAPGPQPFSPAPGAAKSGMPADMKPPQIILMASGGVAFLGSFFAIATSGSGSYKYSANAWDSVFRSFTFLALLALVVGVVVALKTFGVLELPKKVIGFSLNQIAAFVGLYGVLISFAVLISLEGASMGFGLILMLLSSVGLIVGAIMSMKEDAEL